MSSEILLLVARFIYSLILLISPHVKKEKRNLKREAQFEKILAYRLIFSTENQLTSYSNYAHQAVGQGCGSDIAGGRLEARAGRPNGRPMVTRTPV